MYFLHVLKQKKNFFSEDVSQIVVGEMGAAVNIEREQLTEEQKLVYDKGWQNNAFNEYVSDKISLHRTLPDPRLPE